MFIPFGFIVKSFFATADFKSKTGRLSRWKVS